MIDHRHIDERSLAFGRAIAARVAENPSLVDRARATALRWMKTTSVRARPGLQEWLDTMDGPLEGVIGLLTNSDERSVRLRQSNPFTGVLTNVERNTILREFAKRIGVRT